MAEKKVLIIGAGISGLFAAETLKKNGISSVLIDKGRTVGGRMATRRIEADGGYGVFDSGAQFFAFNNRMVQPTFEEWVEAGVAKGWANGFHTAGIGYREDRTMRFIGEGGIRKIPEFMAKDLDTVTGVRIVSVHYEGGTWTAAADDGSEFTGDALLMTPPVPQTLQLLDESGIDLPVEERTALDKIAYDPCIALLALVEPESKVPDPGGLFISGESIWWIADNYKKGISPVPGAVTIFAGTDYSRKHIDDDDETIAKELLYEAERWIGTKVKETFVHRWRFSQPYSLFERPSLLLHHPGPMAFAGDGFVAPHVEGAAISGIAAAEELVSILGG